MMEDDGLDAHWPVVDLVGAAVEHVVDSVVEVCLADKGRPAAALGDDLTHVLAISHAAPRLYFYISFLI
mgnify:CR=1 FL=1